ncbi:MAG: DUF1643 domain-containing protein [Candidatus Faecousia sp.]|nr:DUF1643 domain-containing protein [Bacillota bacterium]MDY4220576.1 DUF1643 domain-containing protein [Candidatus Faecousia sp.]
MGHIPSSDTALLALAPFDRALAQALEPNEHYDVSRWLYVPNAYGEYRYVLGTRGSRPLICVGINPSTAAPDRLDNTLKSVERIALGNGYDSFLMFNVYAQRATDPNAMEQSCNLELHRENLRALEYLLSLNPQPAVWAAWGAIIEKRRYLARCLLDEIALGRRFGARWFTAGPISKKGHPHHPLYLPKSAPLAPFDPERYCREILGFTN